MTSKTFTGTLVLNYKTGGMKLLKRGQHKEGPSDIPVRISIEVVIPEHPKTEITGKIEIPPRKVTKIILDRMVGDDDD